MTARFAMVDHNVKSILDLLVLVDVKKTRNVVAAAEARKEEDTIGDGEDERDVRIACCSPRRFERY